MRPTRNKHLRPAERNAQLLTVGFGQNPLELGQILRLFLPDMLDQVLHKVLDSGEEARVCGGEALECFELLFYLWPLLS